MPLVVALPTSLHFLNAPPRWSPERSGVVNRATAPLPGLDDSAAAPDAPDQQVVPVSIGVTSAGSVVIVRMSSAMVSRSFCWAGSQRAGSGGPGPRVAASAARLGFHGGDVRVVCGDRQDLFSIHGVSSFPFGSLAAGHGHAAPRRALPF